MFEFFANIFLYIAYCVLFCSLLVHMVSYVFPLGTYKFPVQIVSVILIILGSYYVADHRGYQRRVTEDQVEIERLNGEARAKEAELTTKVKNLSSSLQKERNAITSNKARLDARVDSGELRLPSSCGVQTNADAGTTRGSGGGGQSESDRQAIRDIVQIAAEGDKAIIERNACIDWYNQVREKVNDKP